jgi:hypothetical protein
MSNNKPMFLIKVTSDAVNLPSDPNKQNPLRFGQILNQGISLK